jgi:TP901 family phage tail tape measure protein
MSNNNPNISISVQTQKSAAEIKALKDGIKELGAEFKISSESMKYTGSESDKLAEKHKMLAAQLDKQGQITQKNIEMLQKYKDARAEASKKVEEYKTALVEVKKASDKDEEAVKKAAAALNAQEKHYKHLEKEIVKYEKAVKNSEAAGRQLTAELKNTDIELKRHSGSLQQLSGDMELFAENYKKGADSVSALTGAMTGAGKALSLTVTAPVLATGAAASKAAIDFESAFAGVRRTVNGTEKDFEMLGSGIRQMALEIPVTAKEIALVAEAAGQMGIETQNIMNFTRTMLDLGVTTTLSASEAGMELAKFANITQMSQRDFDRLGSSITRLGTNFAATETSIVNMAMRLAGAGTQVGMAEPEILGLAAALSSVGIEAEAGGSAFSKVMVQMQLAVETGNEKLKDFAKVAGMSADGFAKAFKNNAPGAIQSFLAGLNNMERHGKSAIALLDEMGISEVRLRDALLRGANAADMFGDAVALSNKAWAENSALANEAAERYGTTESKLKILKNQFADIAITLGDDFLPFIKSAADSVGKFVSGLGKMSEEGRHTLITVGLLLAALGPLLATTGKVIQVVTGLRTAFALMKLEATLAAKATAAAGTAAAGASAGFAALLGPITLAGIAITGLVLAFNKFYDTEKQQRKVQRISNDFVQLQGDVEETETKLKNVAARIDELHAKGTLEIVEREELEKLEEINRQLEIQLRIRRQLAVDAQKKLEQETVVLLEKRVVSLSYGPEGVSEYLDSLMLPERIDRYIEYYRNVKDVIKELEDAQIALTESGELNSRQFRHNAGEIAYYKELAAELYNQILKDGEALIGYKENLIGATAAGDRWAETIDQSLEKIDAHINSLESENAALLAVEKGARGAGDATKGFNDGVDESTETIKTAVDLLNEYNAAHELLAENVRASEKELSNLRNAYDVLSRGGELSIRQLLEMIELYPELADYINKTGDVTFQNGQILKAVAEVRKKAVLEEMRLEAERLAAMVEAAQQSVEAAWLEYDAKREAARLYYSEAAAMAAEYASSVVDAELAARDALEARLKTLQATIKAIGETGIEISRPSGRSSGAGADTAAREAEQARKAELDAWTGHWKEREENSKAWIDKEKFYGRLSYDAEAEASERVLAYLREACAAAEDLTYATEEEKLKIKKDFAAKIESYERQRYTAENNAAAELLNIWKGHWKEWEDGENRRLDDGKFYNNLRLEDEIDAYAGMIDALREAQAEAAALTYASEEEKAAIVSDFADKIAGYERRRYSAEKALKAEELNNAESETARREKLIKRELDAAETLTQKLAVYAKLRVETERKLTDTLSAISEKYWLSEKERLKEIQAAYEGYSDSIYDIDRRMAGTRKELEQKSADERKEIARKAAEDWYETEKTALDKRYNARKDALNKELQAIRDFYAAIDAEERRGDRDKELGGLYAQEELYRNAATKEGQDRHKSIVDQIERLRRDADREARREEQSGLESKVTGKTASLDETYRAEQEGLRLRRDDMKAEAELLASEISAGMEKAAGNLTDGLEHIYGTYGKGFDGFSEGALDKARTFAAEIERIFRNIDFSFGQASRLAGSGVTNNNRNSSVTLNDFGSKNFYTQNDVSDYWSEASGLAFNMAARRMR